MNLPQLVYGCDAWVIGWVAERIDQDHKFGSAKAIGVYWNKALIAGVVYHEYQEKYSTMQVSIASDKPFWGHPIIISSLFYYPFRQLSVYKLWSAIPLSNERSIQLNKRLGFKQEAILKDQFGPGADCYLSRIIEPEYAQLYEVRDGKEQSSTSACA